MSARLKYKLRQLAGLLAASLGALSSAGVFGQIAKPDLLAGCPAVPGVQAARLYGFWTVRFTNPPPGLPAAATMLLERHAEFSESLAGTVSRDLGTAASARQISGHASKAALAGDFEDGLLLLDESSNNINITGTWNGVMVAGSCGQQFKGTWKDTSSSAPADAPDVPFILQKLP
jgi:hypothetical protein